MHSTRARGLLNLSLSEDPKEKILSALIGDRIGDEIKLKQVVTGSTHCRCCFICIVVVLAAAYCERGAPW